MDIKIKELLSKSEYGFNDLVEITSVLRSENGCPWDREQTHDSIRSAFIEETYEFIEGLDKKDYELMCEELGDVLFQIVFHSSIASDNKKFDINQVIDGISKKMVYRHPHVFADTVADTSEQVLKNWEELKKTEKSRITPYEQLSSVAVSLPSLVRAQKLFSKSKKLSLDLSDRKDAVAALKEKAAQLENGKCDIGEMLFLMCKIAHFDSVDAEESLYKTNEKYLDDKKQ